MSMDLEQLAGYQSIEIYKVTDTNHWPIVVTDENAGSITYLSVPVDFEIEDESIVIGVVPKNTEQGTVHIIEISCAILKRTKEVETFFDAFENIDLVVFGILKTGGRKLFGTNEEPLYLNYKVDAGKKVDDFSNISLIIKGETRQRPVFCN